MAARGWRGEAREVGIEHGERQLAAGRGQLAEIRDQRSNIRCQGLGKSDLKVEFYE